MVSRGKMLCWMERTAIERQVGENDGVMGWASAVDHTRASRRVGRGVAMVAAAAAAQQAKDGGGGFAEACRDDRSVGRGKSGDRA